MTSDDEAGGTARRHDWRLLAKAVLGFWAVHLVYRTAIAALDRKLSDLLDPSLDLALACGFLLSIALCAVLKTVAGRGLAFGLGVAALLSLPVSLGYASLELALYYHLSPEVNGAGSTRTMADGTVVIVSSSGEVSYLRPGRKIAETVKLPPLKQRVRAQAPRIVTANTSGWYFFYFGLGSFFVGLMNAARLREAERRAAEYQRLAQSAQLRALRYQVNPHFLFNTLNSISSLILTRDTEQAEAMILDLSDFFRATLAIDPAADIALSEEIALQRLYLDIEGARFPDRLRVALDIPGDLEAARVPALLLQPLVENAIKHGVARSDSPVTIRIGAGRGGGKVLKLWVENDRDPDATRCHARDGTGVGLMNVAERLRVRFGEDASFAAGPVGERCWRVALSLPLETP